MARRLLALVATLIAAQPYLSWALQGISPGRQIHCTDEVCQCQAARHCPPRRSAAEPCHETAASQTMISEACNHGTEAAPLATTYADGIPPAPALAHASVPGEMEPPVSAARLAGHLEIHSPPPRPSLS
jgi:hypothetical protein